VGAVKAGEEVEVVGVVKRVQLVNNKHEQLFRWHKGETVVAGGQRRHSGIHLLTDFSRRACFQWWSSVSQRIVVTNQWIV